MKNLIKYYIIIFLILLTAAHSMQINKFTDKEISGYELIKENIKQLTVKGDLLSADIRGTKNKNIIIYLTNGKTDIKTLKISDKKELMESDETDEIDLINVEDSLSVRLTLKRKEAELDIDNDEGDVNLIVEVPKDMSVVVSIKNGNIVLNGLNGEFLIDGKATDTEIINCTGVINYQNKSGDLLINKYDGVLNLKTYTGDIELKDLTGMSTIKNVSGSLSADKVQGELNADMEVGDIEIRNSKSLDIDLNIKSGNLKIKDVSGKLLKVVSTTSDIEMSNLVTEMLDLNLTAGDIELKKIKCDMRIDCDLGDISITDMEMFNKVDSDLSVNFGNIEIDLKYPGKYKYYESVNEKELVFKNKLEIDGDVKICKEGGKCLRVSVNIGEIEIK